MITVVDDCDLALGDGFVRLIKSDLHDVIGPVLAHRSGNCRHSMADLNTRPEAPR